MKQKFIGRTAEAVVLLLVDAKGCMIYFDVVAKGSIAVAEMPIRKIVELAIRHNSKTAFVAHNHPSGNILPSQSDLQVTRRLYDTLNGIGVNLVDHFIIGGSRYLSLRESGLMEYY